MRGLIELVGVVAILASTGCGDDGSVMPDGSVDATPGDAGGDAADDGGTGPTVLDHLFQLYSCTIAHEGFCPTGDTADFDREGFRDVYVDPFGAGPAHGVYPPSADGTGSYTGFPVPQCDDSTVGDPVDGSSNPDPSTWTCPDGQSTIRCTDGTRPIAYYFPADDPSSTRWIVGISSGGAQCYGDRCVTAAALNIERFSSVFSGPDTLTRAQRFSAGVFQKPELSDFHRVFIDQCAGGRGLGTNDAVAHYTDETSGETYEIPTHFHGSRIVRATLDRILRMATAPPTQIVFASHSNGSRGAYTEVDGWKAFLDAHPSSGGDVDVRLFANSMVHDSVDIERCNNDPGCTDVLDSYDHAAGGWNDIAGTVSAPGSTDLAAICPATGVGRCLSADGMVRAEVAADGIAFDTQSYQPGGDQGMAAAEWGVTMDTSCMAAHAGELSACLDPMHVMLYHLQTPTYFALSGYDRYMRSENVTACSADYEAWSLGDYHGRLLAVAQVLGEARPGQRDPVRLPGDAVWVDNSGDHQGPTNVHKLDRTLMLDSGEQISLLQSLRAWLDATDAHSPLCISDGEPAEDPTNPMNTSHGGTPAPAATCF